LPAELAAKRLPLGRCACFAISGGLENLDYLRDYVYQYWQANTSERFSAAFDVCRVSIHEKSRSAEMIVPLSSPG
jgi:DNA gyrase inhibitor GyrI